MAGMERSPSPSSRQLGPMTLPSDIVLMIFKDLTQQECLTCMAVCRDWYDMIPQYAQNTWKSLRLGEYDIGKENHRLIRCLGDHVKSVTLDNLERDEAVYSMMYKLLDWGCNKIESLEMYECNTEDQHALLAILKKLGPHLTHLKLMYHHSNVAFLHVFSACQELTHFTYQETTAADPKGDRGVYDKEPVALDAEPIIGTFPKMTHLCLDAVMDRQLRLDPILKRCPNLLVFIGPTMERDLKGVPYSSISINFDLFFGWCPKIVWMEDILGHRTLPDLKSDPDINAIHNRLTGLRHFSVRELGQNSVQQRLIESQHTLKFLAINPWDVSSDSTALPATLKTLQLTQLQTLTIHNTEFDGTSIVSLLNHCPSLETLCLEYEDLELDPSTISRFNPMRKLRSLSWTWIAFVGGLSLLTFLERFPSLETLSLYRLVAPATFPEGCEGPRRLRKLDLFDIEWSQYDEQSDPKQAAARLFEWFAMYSKLETISILCVSNFGTSSLPALGKIATLETLEMGLHEGTQCGEEDEANLHRFTSSLSGTKITRISIIDAQFHIPQEVIRKLNKLPLLQLLCVFHQWESSYCKQCSTLWK